MANLRNKARGQPCMVRGPNCDFDNDKVCLAHINPRGSSTMGGKTSDRNGVIACSSCHDLIDGRVPGVEKWSEAWAIMVLEALLRTNEHWERIL